MLRRSEREGIDTSQPFLHTRTGSYLKKDEKGTMRAKKSAVIAHFLRLPLILLLTTSRETESIDQSDFLFLSTQGAHVRKDFRASYKVKGEFYTIEFNKYM